MELPVDVLFGVLNKERALNGYIYCHGNLVDVDLFESTTSDVRGRIFVGSAIQTKKRTDILRLDKHTP